jgi:hypothetical protein
VSASALGSATIVPCSSASPTPPITDARLTPLTRRPAARVRSSRAQRGEASPRGARRSGPIECRTAHSLTPIGRRNRFTPRRRSEGFPHNVSPLAHEKKRVRDRRSESAAYTPGAGPPNPTIAWPIRVRTASVEHRPKAMRRDRRSGRRDILAASSWPPPSTSLHRIRAARVCQSPGTR